MNSMTCVVKKQQESSHYSGIKVSVLCLSPCVIWLFVLECCADNIFMYVEEIISPDHTDVFLVLPQKDFSFSCIAYIPVLSNGKHLDSKVSTYII